MTSAFSNVEVIGKLDKSSSIEWCDQKPDRSEFKRDWEKRNWRHCIRTTFVCVFVVVFFCLFFGVLL